MLKLGTKVTAVVACVLLNASSNVCALALGTSASPVAATTAAMATLTQKQGDVWKKNHIDWEKESWGAEQQPASLNDRLPEGMMLGTGDNSWAEVSWPNVKTRVWSNSAFAIAPNKRLVYLTQGEMLFRLDKHRRDKDQYYIWTKVLQARIRGTTVLVQAQGPVTRFSVLEGTVEIFNRLDHSLVTLKPGVVYEVVGYQSPDTKTVLPRQTDAKPVTNIIYDSSPGGKTPVFQDSNAASNVYTANSETLREHPLVKAAGGIDSIPLIEKEQQGLPGHGSLLPAAALDALHVNRVIGNGVKIQAVPSNVDYFVGQMVGKNITLPSAAFTDFHPKGVIIGRQSSISAAPAPAPVTAIRPAVPMPVGVPHLIENPEATVLEADEPLPVQEYAPITSAATALTDVNHQPGAFPGVNTSGINAGVTAVTGIMGASTVGAAIGGVGTGIVAPISGAGYGVVSPIASPVVSPITAVSNGATSTVSGTVSGVTSATAAVTSPLSGLTGGLNNTLNGITSGLNLH